MWWLQSAKKLQLPLMASWYLGPLLLLAGLHGLHSLRGAAAVVTVVGVVDSLQFLLRGQLSPLMVALSVICHGAVFIPYLYTTHCSFSTTFAHSTALLVAVLAIYAWTRAWPYTFSPLVTLVLGLAIVFVSS